MAKQQQFFDLFAKYDEDKDGQIDQSQFIQLITELGISYQYPGTVTKIIRRLNPQSPEKLTLNLSQAKEYYDSFQSQSKHQIWKAKLSLLSTAHQIRQSISGVVKSEGAAPSAAPGSEVHSKQEPDKKAQEGHLKILIGQPKAVYSSELDLQFEKSQKLQKAKPFLKIQVSCKSEERAKKLQTIFKDCFNTLVDIFAEEQPQYANIAKGIHINSVVSNCKTTFFVTTASEDAIQYIQTLAEFFELSFNHQLVFQGNLRFQFDYDFQKFINEPGSSFYDIFAQNCKLKVDVSVFNLLKSLRKLLKVDVTNNSQLPLDMGLLTALMHIEHFEGDLQFQNSQVEGETETKEELISMLGWLGTFFNELQSKQIEIKQLIQLLDENILLEANGGDWKATLFLRLKNINKIFLQYIPQSSETTDD